MIKKLGATFLASFMAFMALALLGGCGGGGGSSSSSSVASITLSPTSATFNVGLTWQFTATAKDSAGNTVSGATFTWNIGNTAVATVDSSGNVKGVAAGTTYVTASSGGKTSAQATVTITAEPALTITKTGAGTGTVTSSPSGINCGSTCTAAFTAGQSVILTAAPDANSTFSGWSGACTGTGTCTLTMSSDKTATATFAVLNSISGTVTNALGTNAPLSGVAVSLYSGSDNTAGTPVATATTNSSGYYSLSGIAAGNYTVKLLLGGYETISFNVSNTGGQTTANRTMTPVLSSSADIRIVLTWGASPADLDAHLTGPVDPRANPSTARFHVYYSSKIYLFFGTTYATLDTNVQSGSGPETVTIPAILTGTYRFSVHNNSATGNALSGSGATVSIYQGANPLATFNVPSGTGNLWTVFELTGTAGSGATITSVNTISTQTDPTAIQ